MCSVEYALNEKVKEIGKDLAARAKLIGTMIEYGRHLLSSKDSAGNTPLHVAAMCPSASPLIQILLQAAPDAAGAVNSANNLLQNPIHVAVVSGATENLRLLLAEGSRAASLCDVNGNNSLALAVLHKCEEKIVKTLLDGLDDLEKMLVFEQENGEGMYSLTLAVGILAQKEILEVRERRGAKRRSAANLRDMMPASRIALLRGSLRSPPC
jgi:ankyrin repeat protein